MCGRLYNTANNHTYAVMTEADDWATDYASWAPEFSRDPVTGLYIMCGSVGQRAGDENSECNPHTGYGYSSENWDRLSAIIAVSPTPVGPFRVIHAEEYYQNLVAYNADGSVKTIEVEENGTTFEQNALIKAKAIYKICRCAVISDDSGLMVDALDGEPGVYSARYAGEPCNDANNNAKLLKKLEGITDTSAHFVSAVAFYDGVRELTATGTVEGKIIFEHQGDNGFGYDPYFYCHELGKTFGNACADEKNAVSHRARALKKLVEML
jgi:XTP/dITP diphosphohydrolase